MHKISILLIAVVMTSCACVHSVYLNGYKLTVAGAIEMTKERPTEDAEYPESIQSYPYSR